MSVVFNGSYASTAVAYSTVPGSWSATNIVGSQTFYTCYSCGLGVESSKWNEHLSVFHQQATAAVYQPLPNGGLPSLETRDLQDRVMRLEGYLLDERQKLLDEIEALKSIRGTSVDRERPAP